MSYVGTFLSRLRRRVKFILNFRKRGTQSADCGDRKQRLRLWERIMSLRGTGGTRDTISGRRCPSCGSPLAGEHNPGCSHPHQKSIAYPKSSRGPVASAKTCDELRQRRSSSVCSARGGDATSDRNAHWAGGWCYCFAVLFTDLLDSREAEFSVYLHYIATV